MGKQGNIGAIKGIFVAHIKARLATRMGLHNAAMEFEAPNSHVGSDFILHCRSVSCLHQRPCTLELIAATNLLVFAQLHGHIGIVLTLENQSACCEAGHTETKASIINLRSIFS